VETIKTVVQDIPTQCIIILT